MRWQDAAPPPFRRLHTPLKHTFLPPLSTGAHSTRNPAACVAGVPEERTLALTHPGPTPHQACPKSSVTRCRAMPAARTSGARSWYASWCRALAPPPPPPPATVSGRHRPLLERRAGGGLTRSTCARTRWQTKTRRRRMPARCRAPGRRLSARCTAQRCDCDPPAQRGHEWREYEAGTELCVREGRRGWPVCMWIGRAVNRSNPCMCASRVETVSCFPESVPMRVRFFLSEVGDRKSVV